ncbi:MAG: glucose-1-phosphate adenylyltransferase subunit GlgD [Lachnospiraceae bacterium]|nr:glucose-1-phosphate adenylyltransferase subunit GlgD [Lachnospiraceae bacterium]
MVNSNKKALGLIFPNSYDNWVPELVNVRLMASIPFASRYRMVDFVLSSMANSGIDNISVIVKKNYHSLMDHLGSGREWDLVRKHGGLNIFPPFMESDSRAYLGRAGALANTLDFLRSQKEKYVVMTDSNIAVNFDFSKMIDAHIESGADITVAYNEQELPANFLYHEANDRDHYYTLNINNGRVEKILINAKDKGVQNFSMNMYVVERELLINLINEASLRGNEYFERDVLIPQLGKLNVQAYKYDGYLARITGMKSYFDENMKLLDDYNIDALFEGNQIYTKIRDDNPTRYIDGAKVKNTMAADGCVIEGEVENCVLFRGVKIAKGAVVKNCVLMQDTVVEAGANVEYTITDKDVVISAGKELKGNDSFPVYIPKFHKV